MLWVAKAARNGKDVAREAARNGKDVRGCGHIQAVTPTTAIMAGLGCLALYAIVQVRAGPDDLAKVELNYHNTGALSRVRWRG